MARSPNGGAICRVQQYGYCKLANTLVVASLEGVGQGWLRRITFNSLTAIRVLAGTKYFCSVGFVQ
jgi:hypothetical protein